MPAVETRQMSTIETGLCPVTILYIRLVSTADICPVSAADICPVTTADICPVSTEDIYPVSTEHTMSIRAQIIENGPNRVQNRPFGLKLGPNES